MNKQLASLVHAIERACRKRNAFMVGPMFFCALYRMVRRATCRAGGRSVSSSFPVDATSSVRLETDGSAFEIPGS